MAKKDASVCTIFGTGIQAAFHMKAIMEIVILKKFIIFSRNENTAAKFCDLHNKNIKCEIGSKNLKRIGYHLHYYAFQNSID